MQELQHLASGEHMIPDAPVQAARSITIDAPIEKVWAIQTDVPRWPSWYAYLSDAQLAGPFAAGTNLSYGGRLGHKLVVAKVRSPELAMIYGKLMGYSAVTKWELERISEERTKVTFKGSSAGFMIGALYGDENLASTSAVGWRLSRVRRSAGSLAFGSGIVLQKSM